MPCRPRTLDSQAGAQAGSTGRSCSATHTSEPHPGQAVASADQCIYLYAAEDDKYGLGPEGEPLNLRRRVADNPPSGFRYLAKCSGHSSTVNHLDWSTDSRVLQSNDQSYELLYWQADRLSPVSSMDMDMDQP